MKFSKLVGELRETENYRDFMSRHKSAFLAAGFFVVGDEEKYQLDFFIPELKKMATVEWPFEKNKIIVQGDKIEKAEKLDENIVLDIEQIMEKVDFLVKEKKINIKISKIISILKDNIWNLTCLSPSLSMIRVKINALTGELISFEEVSFMDMARVIKKK